MTGRRYLITGGAGFIGSHLAALLAARGDAVAVLDDLSTGRSENLPPGTPLVQGDIADPAARDPLLAGAAGCFHLAAVASVDAYRADWTTAARTNLLGSVALLEAAARAGVPVVYASSAAVYGDSPALPLTETEAPRPISGYGADKLGLELHAGAMAASLGLRATGLRFFNVYGPRQQPGSPYSGVISIFLDRLRRGLPLVLNAGGAQERDFVYAGDVARALARAMEHAAAGGGGVFNVCTGRAVSIRALAGVLAAATGRMLQTEIGPARPGDIARSLGDPARAAAALGFRAETMLEDGLARTALWFGAAARDDGAGSGGAAMDEGGMRCG